MTCVDAYCGYFHNLSTLESSTFMVGCHKVHSHHNHDNRRIDDIMIVDATHIQLIHMESSEIPSTNNSTVSPNALMHLLLFRATRDHRRVVCGRARATNQQQTIKFRDVDAFIGASASIAYNVDEKTRRDTNKHNAGCWL